MCPSALYIEIPSLVICFSTYSELAFLSYCKEKIKEKRCGAIILQCLEWKFCNKVFFKASFLLTRTQRKEEIVVLNILFFPFASRDEAELPKFKCF